MTAQPDLILVGDYLIDADGVIVGHARADSDWQPTTDTDVDWVLGLLLEAETQVYAYEKQKQTILANLTALQREQEHRIDWLRGRFAAALEEFAAVRLEGEKKRTLRFPHGMLRFRWTQKKRIVRDEKLAIEWAKEHLPGAVAVSERLLVSDLPDDVPGVEVVPPHDTFRIEGL